eukprot:8185469-Lingulodinium_polyedra.AAC.1
MTLRSRLRQMISEVDGAPRADELKELARNGAGRALGSQTVRGRLGVIVKRKAQKGRSETHLRPFGY